MTPKGNNFLSLSLYIYRMLDSIQWLVFNDRKIELVGKSRIEQGELKYLDIANKVSLTWLTNLPLYEAVLKKVFDYHWDYVPLVFIAC